MNDQKRITDLILTEKRMSVSYDTFTSRHVDVRLRGELLKLLDQDRQTQAEPFQTAQQKGWYRAEQILASQIGTAYTRFDSRRPQ